MWRTTVIVIVSIVAISLAFIIFDALRPVTLPRPIHAEGVSPTCATLPADPSSSLSSNEAAGVFLNNLGLPRLDCGPSGADEVYRFTWGHAFSQPHPISVTIMRRGTAVSVDAREYQFTRRPPYSIVTETNHDVTMLEWHQIENAVDASPFWTVAGYTPDGAFDGGSWIIEARIHDGYHRASWWEPGSAHERGGEEFKMAAMQIARLGGYVYRNPSEAIGWERTAR